jgi:hypothetical protein
MTAVTRPRGPLPPRVYWTRRVLLLVVAVGLVLGIARLLGGTNGDGGAPVVRQAAQQSSAAPTSTPTSATSSTAAVATATPSPSGRPAVSGTASPSAPLAQPTGSCSSTDIVAVPSVAPPAYAGRPVVLTTTLTTRESPACTWDVSAQTLVVKVTSGADRIWSTQECPGSVPQEAVVVRRDAPVTVAVVWNGLRSGAGCTPVAWAESGYYHVQAAAFGADPVDVQIHLVRPVAATVTKTPKPSPSSTSTPRASASSAARTSRPHSTATPRSTRTPSASPSTHR